MADKLRNEVSVTLGGQERTMRATFGAIRAIEGQLGNIVPLIDKISRGDAGVFQNAVIITEGLRGAEDTRMSLDDVGNAILKDGLKNIGGAVAQFLVLALEGVPLVESAAAE